MVKFTETHVGHDDELRSKRLSKNEQNLLVGQLTAGVTNNKIIQDARKIENKQLKRINEPSSQLYHQNDKKQFIQENSSTQDQGTSLSFNKMREVIMLTLILIIDFLIIIYFVDWYSRDE